MRLHVWMGGVVTVGMCVGGVRCVGHGHGGSVGIRTLGGGVAFFTLGGVGAVCTLGSGGSGMHPRSWGSGEARLLACGRLYWQC